MSARRRKLVELLEAFTRAWGPANPAYGVEGQPPGEVATDGRVEKFATELDALLAAAIELGGESASTPPGLQSLLERARVVARTGAPFTVDQGVPRLNDDCSACVVCGAPASFLVATADYCQAHVPRTTARLVGTGVMPAGHAGALRDGLLYEPADRDVGISAAVENLIDDELDYSEDNDPGE